MGIGGWSERADYTYPRMKVANDETTPRRRADARLRGQFLWAKGVDGSDDNGSPKNDIRRCVNGRVMR